jgi:SAM-dependent methyltransferase
MPIPVIRGRQPESWEGEFKEFTQYDSGKAEANAKALGGNAEEPWVEVIKAFEPSAFPAVARMLADERLRPKIKGTVIDVGAGTCFLSAKLSQLPEVEKVYPIDLSERFLTTTGARVLAHFGAATEKITFVATDFNSIPLPTASADAAFIFAAIHHSLSPIKTLQEVGRVVKPGGTVFILENPKAVIDIRNARRVSYSLSAENTEIAYTRAELEYLILNANIGSCETLRWDVLSRPGPRRWIRTIVRALGLEDVLINPPNYLFVITRR